MSVVLAGRPVAAQDGAPSSDAGRFGNWEPFGQIPVDQAGAGRRGYALAGESSEVTGPGLDQITFHTLAENNFYREQTDNFLVTERSETHTLALGYRRGFAVPGLPRFELGGQIQLHERDNGVLNGFIIGFEDLFASLTGRTGAKNTLRTGVGTAPPLGMFVTKNGQPLYQASGDGSGFGDVSIVAKALIRGGAPSSGAARVAARVGLNVSGQSDFTEGNFVGVGISLDKKLSSWAALHGDTRVTVMLDRASQLGLPLQRASFGFSVGPELKLTRATSLTFQIDGNTTPYRPTGTMAFDKDYGDVTLGLNHAFPAGRRQIVIETYGRENMNLPFYIRWNADPDFAVGLKVTLRPASR
jgi:hypothetical protein